MSAQHTPNAARFHKVSAAGLLLPVSATDWEGVYDRDQDLVFGRRLLPGMHTHADAVKAAAAATLCAQRARIATVRERVNITDFARSNPALDTDYFHADSGWEWTLTEYKPSPSGYAWCVCLDNGFVSYGNRDDYSGVRAVCAGQLFSFGGAKR